MKQKTLILDMDGTLYRFKGGSFRKSGIFVEIRKNSIELIRVKLKKSLDEATEIFEKSLARYERTIGLSVGLEQEFGINRYEYFNNAWNLDAAVFIDDNPEIKPLLVRLNQEFNLVLLSDAPRVWIESVLKFYGIKDLFDGQIFSGEGEKRKEYGNAFDNLLDITGSYAANCISVGDQLETDIVPAKELGMTTILIGESEENLADFSIDDITKIEKILQKIHRH